MFSPDQMADLAKPLLQSNVSKRDQSGRELSYIESWWAISEANRIFGFDGWGRETVEIRLVAEREREIGQNKTPGWSVSYIGKVRVTVSAGGTLITREGCGAGHGIDRDLGQAHESAVKEMESDAAKRALMTFGNQFGLALYDRDQEGVLNDTAPAPRPSQKPADPRSETRVTGPAPAPQPSAAPLKAPAQAPSAPKMMPRDWVMTELPIIRAAPTPAALKAWEKLNGARMDKLKAMDESLWQDIVDNIDARAKELLK